MDFIKLRKVFKEKARKKAFSEEDQDDIAQEAIILYLERKKKKTSLNYKYIFIDALRESKTLPFDRFNKQIKEILFYQDEAFEVMDSLELERQTIMRLELLRIDKILNKYKRKNVFLLYILGFKMHELAKQFDLTQPGISLIVKEARERITNANENHSH